MVEGELIYSERLCYLVVGPIRSGTRLPRFKSQVHQLVAIWSWRGYLISRFLHLLNRNINSNYLIGLLWRLKELIHVICIEQYLAQSRCLINASYYYYVRCHLVCQQDQQDAGELELQMFYILFLMRKSNTFTLWLWNVCVLAKTRKKIHKKATKMKMGLSYKERK